MKKVVISGYYGYDNVGDEALLKAIVEALRSYDEKLCITVLSAQPEKTANKLGVDAVSRTNLTDIIREIKSSNLLISGGGSLLQDVTGPLTIPYYLGIVAMAKMLKKPVVFYAQGVGPVNGSLGRILIKKIVNKVDLITLRDKESAQLMKSIGVKNPPIKITADPVFGLKNANPKKDIETLNQLGIDSAKGPVVGIAIRSWPGYEESLEALAKAADYVHSTGRQVVLLPMHYPVDRNAALDLKKLMDTTPVLIDKNLGPEQLLSLIGNLDFLIGMRLHALIFAAVVGVPPIGVSYDPKVEQFLLTPGCISAGSVESIDSNTLIEKIDYVIDNRREISNLLMEQCNILRGKAMENAALVMDMLKK